MPGRRSRGGPSRPRDMILNHWINVQTPDDVVISNSIDVGGAVLQNQYSLTTQTTEKAIVTSTLITKYRIINENENEPRNNFNDSIDIYTEDTSIFDTTSSSDVVEDTSIDDTTSSEDTTSSSDAVDDTSTADTTSENTTSTRDIEDTLIADTTYSDTENTSIADTKSAENALINNTTSTSEATSKADTTREDGTETDSAIVLESLENDETTKSNSRAHSEENPGLSPLSRFTTVSDTFHLETEDYSTLPGDYAIFTDQQEGGDHIFSTDQQEGGDYAFSPNRKEGKDYAVSTVQPTSPFINLDEATDPTTTPPPTKSPNYLDRFLPKDSRSQTFDPRRSEELARLRDPDTVPSQASTPSTTSTKAGLYKPRQTSMHISA